jgi:hypothetical protein
VWENVGEMALHSFQKTVAFKLGISSQIKFCPKPLTNNAIQEIELGKYLLNRLKKIE